MRYLRGSLPMGTQEAARACGGVGNATDDGWMVKIEFQGVANPSWPKVRMHDTCLPRPPSEKRDTAFD